MEMIPTWLVDNWDTFSIWVANQPTFVEVAIGVGLFYAVLQIVKLLYKSLAFLFAGVFAGPRRFKRRRKTPPQTRAAKSASMDDDAPPFVFR